MEGLIWKPPHPQPPVDLILPGGHCSQKGNKTLRFALYIRPERRLVCRGRGRDLRTTRPEGQVGRERKNGVLRVREVMAPGGKINRPRTVTMGSQGPGFRPVAPALTRLVSFPAGVEEEAVQAPAVAGPGAAAAAQGGRGRGGRGADHAAPSTEARVSPSRTQGLPGPHTTSVHALGSFFWCWR